ncbi:MAG: hypothetical protein GY749_16765 [Desulfobacteraceae bacterium]|nr:hypothetical protein [Desulfobacteraceae bacterium]
MIIITMGMHRSGTSALAGLLHHSRIVMGEDHNFIPKPSSENTKGFYENYQFRKINDYIIEKSGYVVKSWDPDIPKMKSGFFTKYNIRKILRKYDRRYDNWGWKDPRTCLTLAIWLKEIIELNMITDCKLVYIVRNPYSVAHSMVARKNTDYETALSLWIKYNECALEAIDRHNTDTFYLTYEDLCGNPVEMFRSVADFIKVPFDKTIIREFIDPGLNRSRVADVKYEVSYNLDKDVNRVREVIHNRLNKKFYGENRNVT